jgi:glycosyltransferase involved in cell wall biosynthesis
MEQFLQLEKYEKSDIRLYGHIERSQIDEILDHTDLVLMPSLFLETFGLVALNSLTR